MKRIKYFYKLLFSYIFVLLVAFILLSVMFLSLAENLAYETKVEELTSYGTKIIDELEKKEMDVHVVKLKHFSSLLRARDTKFFIFNEKGEITQSPVHVKKNPLLSEAEWKKIQHGETLKIKRDVNRFEQPVSIVAIPYMRNGELQGGVMLTSPIHSTLEIITELNRYLLIAAGVTFLIVLVVSIFFSRSLVKRVQRLRKASAMIAKGQYDVHIPIGQYDEIGLLGNDFNNMAQQLQKAQTEINRLEKRKRQFIADVSHELKTPLTTINGLVEGMKNDLIPEEKKQRCYEMMEQETKRLIRLVNETLDYEKILSNEITLQKEEIDVKEIFEVISEQLELQAEEKGNKIEIDVPARLFVYADYDRLLQILLNITKNSLQFTENGTILLRGKEEGQTISIEITDTGIGMKQEEVAAVWSRFYKADASRTNSYGEFGLGLSIVKELVKLHDGTIEVTSEQDKGTTFIIRFLRS
ncbi:sensor histidine kinase [Bacillus sp. NPDC077411]|uniref:sensor histidine kinase n=1 Tax=Bacillus sp. NPDC077411 TaxID=3363947 RepID=UPI0037C90A97